MNDKNLWAMLQPPPQQKMMSMAGDPSSDIDPNELPPAPTLEDLAADPGVNIAPPSSQAFLPPQMPDMQPSSSPYEKQMFDLYKGQIGDRKAMLDKLKAKLADTEANKPTGADAVNLKPFLTFADQLNGTNSAQGYTLPPQVTGYQDKLQKLQDAVQSGSDKLSDDQLNYLKMKSLEATRLDANNARRQFYQSLGDRANAKIAQGDDRIAMAAGKNVDHDPLIIESTRQNQNLNKASETLANGGMITPQILSEIENDLAAAFNGKGAATDHVRKNVEMNSTNRMLADIKQKLTNNPQGVNMPQYLQQLGNVIQRLQEANQINIKSRADQLSAGVSNLSSAKAKKTVADKVSALTGGNKTSQASGPKAGDVEDGHVFLGGDPKDPNNWKAQ